MKKTLKVLLKGYLYKNAAKDVWKFVRDNVEDIDLGWDRERLLHRIGLAEYEPVKTTFAGISFFALGAIAGGIAALALAPKRGEELRTEVKDRAMMLFNRASEKAQEAGAMPS
jgi:hypothetical protein